MSISMPNAKSGASSVREQARRTVQAAAPLAVGAIVGIAGWEWAAGRRADRRQLPHTDAAPAGTPATGQQTELVPGVHGEPHGLTPTAGGTTIDKNASAHRVKIAAAIARRPRPTLAVAALVVVAGISPIVMFADRADRPAPVMPSPTTSAAPAFPPAQMIPAAMGADMCRDDCVGQRFTMEFGKPWLVSQVGFRPLELVPGRRVTRVRWELLDPERKTDGGAYSFTQNEDSGAGHNIALSHLGDGSGYRTLEIVAVVETTVPAPGAGPSAHPAARPPLVAVGNRTEDSTDAQDVPAHWVTQHENGALTLRFRKPITLTQVVITPKDGE